MKTYHLNNQRFIESLEMTKQDKLHLINKAIRENKTVDDRISQLRKDGVITKNVAMGSGGVGQIKVLKNGTIRVQISYGTGRWNYAQVAII